MRTQLRFLQCIKPFPIYQLSIQYMNSSSMYSSSSSSAVFSFKSITRSKLYDHRRLFSTMNDSKQPLSLRKVAQPFLLLYHPDRLASATDVVRTTNLVAVQTLNGFIDCIESIYDRACNKRSLQQHGRLDIQPIYSVEFMLPINKSMSKSRHEMETTIPYTRRSVEIIFSEHDRMSVQAVNAEGHYSISAATNIRNKARRDIIKLLNIAGLHVPVDADLHDSNTWGSTDDPLEDHLLHNELDLNRHNAQRYKEWVEPTMDMETSRGKFMEKMDWKKHKKMYYDALEDMKRDLHTDGLIGSHEERREIFLSNIVSRIRINAMVENHDFLLDPIQQLIAIRRLSVLLLDNFEYLEMEDFGRMWETLTIVLDTPCNNPDPLPLHGNNGIPKWRKETGFKFTIHNDNSVTVSIPIDFRDEDFLHEMKSNLADFYEFCVSSDGLDEFFPPYYKEWTTDARRRKRL